MTVGVMFVRRTSTLRDRRFDGLPPAVATTLDLGGCVDGCCVDEVWESCLNVNINQ